MDKPPARSSDAFRVTQTILDAIETGITVFNSRFELVAWNRAFEEMDISEPGTIRHGLSLAENYRHIARRGIFGPGDPDRLAEERWAMAKAGTSPAVEDIRATDGRVIEVRRYFLPGIGVAALFTDVTRMRLAEQRAQHAESLAHLGRVAGGLVHDFNNLLTVIIGSLERERRRETSENVRLALTAANRGADLCRTSLALSIPQPEQVTAQSISGCLEEAATFFRRVLPETVRVELKLPETDCFVRADRTRLTTALLNLALNAKDAMPSGGKLFLEARRSGEGEVSLEVSDEGIGMSRDTLSRIREGPYSTKRDAGGTGLGLAEVRRFVAECDGRIRITSKESVGTTIRIWLPETEPEPARDPRQTERPTLQNLPTLLVEDDPDVRGVLRSMLDDIGAETVAVASTEEARAALDANSFRLLVTDYLLDEVESGLELAHAAREIDPSIGVVLCSGYQNSEIDRASLEIAILPKPFERKRLRAAVDRALKQRDPENGR